MSCTLHLRFGELMMRCLKIKPQFSSKSSSAPLKTLFLRTSCMFLTLLSLLFAKKSLSKIVTKKEVLAALNYVSPYKALGPNGFQVIFYKQFWHIIGDHVFHVVKNAFFNSFFDQSNSDTFISFVPKVDSSIHFRDFVSSAFVMSFIMSSPRSS